MDEEKAKTLSFLLGGEAWHSGGGIWLIHLKREDGSLVVLAEDGVSEYADYEAFEEGRPITEISLR